MDLNFVQSTDIKLSSSYYLSASSILFHPLHLSSVPQNTMHAHSPSSSSSSSSFHLARAPVHNPSFSSVLPARPFFPFSLVRPHTRRLAPLVASQERLVIEAVDETGDVQEIGEMEGYIEVGDIRGAHGVKGEVKVAPTTDFPEIRFGKPGKRWLKIRDGGKHIIKEIVLTKGRCNPGQNGWIIGFKGIDSIEEAKHILGSTVMVKEEDKPELDEGEFYTPDLIGMRVVLKETGELVGTLSNVLTTKGNDILQVKPASDETESSTESYILIPFVDEIVPDVDTGLGEIRITPPKGLLEMNRRDGASAKKEKRLMEWKQKKKSQQRLSTAKKILTEMEQIHVLDALRLADKNQKPILAKQIASFDFRLFQHAVKNLNKPQKGPSQDLNKIFSLLLKNAMKISHESLIGSDNEGNNNKFNSELRAKGSDILSKSKAAFVIVKSQTNKTESGFEIKNYLEGIGEILKGEEGNSSGPVVIVAPTHEVQTFEECLNENDYFGLDHQKVWVLEEGRLPIFSGQQGSKILFKSPSEILEAPVGPGGVFSLLSFHKIYDAFDQLGVEYVQICSFDDKSSIRNPLFFGYVNSLGAEIGIKLHNNKGNSTSFDTIISMKHINKISNDVNELRFDAVFEKNVHVEKGKDGWVDVNPDELNSYRICLPMYGLLDSCLLDEVCVMNVVD
ncbi:hypothetical protein LUZ60_008207 [Juncus effusus]|nr:hypothetical protein LUZ60_008207 [Juncus effusus]